MCKPWVSEIVKFTHPLSRVELCTLSVCSPLFLSVCSHLFLSVCSPCFWVCAPPVSECVLPFVRAPFSLPLMWKHTWCRHCGLSRYLEPLAGFSGTYFVCAHNKCNWTSSFFVPFVSILTSLICLFWVEPHFKSICVPFALGAYWFSMPGLKSSFLCWHFIMKLRKWTLPFSQGTLKTFYYLSLRTASLPS